MGHICSVEDTTIKPVKNERRMSKKTDSPQCFMIRSGVNDSFQYEGSSQPKKFSSFKNSLPALVDSEGRSTYETPNFGSCGTRELYASGLPPQQAVNQLLLIADNPNS